MPEQKTLKIKRVFVISIYNSLRATAPREFPTTGEIKDTISFILPSLKEHVSSYIDMTTQAEALAIRVSAKEIEEDAAKVAVDEINKVWREYTKEHGQDVCEVLLSEEAFKTLRGQFEREGWGSKWTANLDEYSEVAGAFSEAAK